MFRLCWAWPFRGGGHQAVGHDAAAQDQPNQAQDALVGDGLSQAGDQPVMVNPIEGLHDTIPTTTTTSTATPSG